MANRSNSIRQSFSGWKAISREASGGLESIRTL